MRRCPTCQRTYSDETVRFCRHDGTPLSLDGSPSEGATLILSDSRPDDHSSELQRQDGSPSIAVLPFVNISADPENEYFCDGLAEELLNALAKIEELKVAARTSAFSFKGKDIDVREIGRKLTVGAVLEGSVRKSGSHLRISAQLINVADGYRLWSHQYDHQLEDVFAIQEEISLAIADGLKLKLLGNDRAALLKRYTDNAEAYQLYLKGRYHQNTWTAEGIRRSVDYFYQAISLDPNYALAYAGLADSYASLGAPHAFGMAVTETAPKAKGMAVRALEIDPNLAEGHASLGLVKLNFDWDWDGAEKAFKRALELNPNYASTYHWYSHYLISQGRFEESLAASKRALDLDPLDKEINVHLAWHYYFAREYDLVLEAVRNTLEIDPNFTEAYWFMGWALERKGLFDEAIVAYSQSNVIEGKHELSAWLGFAYARSGNEAEARRLLEKLRHDSEQTYVSPYWIAIVYLGLNDKDQAFEWLHKALVERTAWLAYLKVNPIFDSLRSDVRFEHLLKQIGLTS